MKKTYMTLAAILLAGAVTLPGTAALAEFPDKPITMLIGFRPGGAVDTTARLIAKNLEKDLGVPIVAVQKAGGGGTVMATTLINMKPDGYTIGMGASAAYALAPQLNSKLSYTIDSFDHIATVTIPQDALVVRKDAPWNSYQELIDDAKKNNKVLALSSQVSVSRLMAIAITNKTGVKFKIVPVKGGAAGIQQVLGGHVDMHWGASGWHQQVDAGAMKPLFSLGSERNEDYADIPTLKELGIDYAFTDTFMLSAPKGLPPEVLEKLTTAVKNALTPELKKELIQKMKLSADYRDPKETVAFLHDQYNTMKPFVAEMRKEEATAEKK